MEKSPCLTKGKNNGPCPEHRPDVDKRHHEPCVNCEDRHGYANRLGRPGVGSVPDAMGDAGRLMEKPHHPGEPQAADGSRSAKEDARTKTCKRCGDEKPIKVFRKNVMSKDGRLNVCEPCMSKKISAGHRKKGRKKDTATPAVKGEASRASRPEEKKKALIVPIDFTGFEDLVQQINTRAANDLRPFEMEVIWLLKKAVILPLGA